MFNKVKILVLGPCESGKSVLSNFLADATESASGSYRPTQGVRILECEVDGISLGGNHAVNIEVVLWDCSGSQKFEICWPSMQRDVNGVLFVYNPGVENHLKELENWHLHFAKELGLKDKQCMIFAHQKPGITAQGKLSELMSPIQLLNSNIEEDPDTIRDVFKKFLTNVVVHINDRRDQEELSIIE